MNMFMKLCVLAILAVMSKAAIGQGVNPNGVGFVPFGMYQHTDIDSVNMENGNAVIHIPLFGYPQRGSSLTLNYSIIANTSLWQPDIQCYNDKSDEGGVCDNTYQMGSTPSSGMSGFYPCGYVPNASPAIQSNGSQTWCNNIVATQNCIAPGATLSIDCSDFLTTIYYVVEPTGEEHRLQYDASNLSLLRTTDGSGYLLQVDDPQPYYPWMPPTCTYSETFGEGCSYSFKDISGSVLINSKGVKLYRGGQVDTNGNSILGGPNTNIVDTVGRVIPPPPQQATSASTEGCPTLNAQYQPASGSATWTVPGPNGQPTTFLLCFATVKYQTNFWGYGPQGAAITTMHGDESETVDGYFEAKGTESVLQSVVLPDKTTYWGFAYDAANPSDPSSIAYGTLTQILTPEGSSISYKYDFAFDCGVYIEGEPVTVQYITQRTLTDANGNTFPWGYGFGMLNTGGPNLSLLSIASDPDNNDTVYGFTSYGCNYRPATTVHYAGSYTQNHVLRTENTAYPAVIRLLDPPYFAGWSTIANPSPQSTTVIDEVGNQAQTTYSYDSGFTSAMPYCTTYQDNDSYGDPPPTAGPCTPNNGITLGVSFGLQTSRSVFNYNGAPLASFTTNYKWQSPAANNPYYSANLLSLPCLQAVYGPSQPAGLTPSCTLGAQSNLMAETSYGYDENNGSPQGALGNRTSVNKLLLGSNSVLTTSTVFNTQGMPVSTIDPRGNATTITYDGTRLFPFSVQQPTTNIQHIDYYSYDLNTGNVLWHTDQNGGRANDPAHTTYYAYNDPFGRLTQILYPPTSIGQGETDTSYSDTARTVTTIVKASPNPSQTSVKMYDSFGRLAQTTLPSGATQETTYDAMGRAQSVSNPHFTTPSNTDGYTTYAYDDLGRKLYQCQPDNGTGSGSCVPGSSYQRWQYSGNVTTITDEVGKSTQQTADALGRLTQVVEPGSLVTNYSYDALNNLLTVKQLGNAANGDIQRTRSFSYDSLSRLLTTFNPETGSVSYVYDANGNVVFKTSPAVNGASGTQTIGYCYDVLNRITYKFYSAPPSNCTNPTGYAASFTYDSSPISGASNTAGRLTEEQSFAGGTRVSDRKPYAYDSMGRLLRELQYTYAKMNSGTPYSPAYTYDLAGNLLTSTDGTTPSPTTPGATLTFTNVLDGAGRLSTVTSNWSDPLHPLTLFSAQTGETPPCANSSSAPYAASGGLQNAAFGIGSANVSALTLKRAYDSRLRTNCEIDW